MGDSSTIFSALLLSNYCKRFFIPKRYKEYLSEDSYQIQFKNSKQHQSFICEIFSDFKKLSAKQKASVLNIIDLWIKNSLFIDSMTDEYNVDALQLLYSTPMTRALFKKYIKSKFQTWESLSSHESADLYINSMNYFETMDASKRKLLFSRLKNNAKALDKMNR